MIMIKIYGCNKVMDYALLYKIDDILEVDGGCFSVFFLFDQPFEFFRCSYASRSSAYSNEENPKACAKKK